MNEIALAKAQLRSKILASRLKREPSAQALTANLLELVSRSKASRVATYISVGSEPPTTDFCSELLEQGLTVLVPKVLDDGLLAWFKWDGVSAVRSEHGLLEPDASRLEHLSISEADLLIIPALAVDTDGNRLGRGKGFFDRELEQLSETPVYAVCFEDEFLESLPNEAHDQRVNGVVTEVTIHELN